MDDDGSTKQVLKWKLLEFKKAVLDGEITDGCEEFAGKNGKLDRNHPFITFLANTNHRVRTMLVLSSNWHGKSRQFLYKSRCRETETKFWILSPSVP
jgi:hypothetical protein